MVATTSSKTNSINKTPPSPITLKEYLANKTIKQIVYGGTLTIPPNADFTASDLKNWLKTLNVSNETERVKKWVNKILNKT